MVLIYCSYYKPSYPPKHKSEDNPDQGQRATRSNGKMELEHRTLPSNTTLAAPGYHGVPWPNSGAAAFATPAISDMSCSQSLLDNAHQVFISRTNYVANRHMHGGLQLNPTDNHNSSPAHVPSTSSSFTSQSSTSPGSSLQAGPGELVCTSLSDLMSFMMDDYTPQYYDDARPVVHGCASANSKTISTWLSSFEELEEYQNDVASNVLIDSLTDGSLDVDLHCCQDFYDVNTAREEQDQHQVHALATSSNPSSGVFNAQDSDLNGQELTSVTPTDVHDDAIDDMQAGSGEEGYAEDYNGVRLVHLLVMGAEAVAERDMELATVILLRLRELVSSSGTITTMHRVAACFTDALQRRLEGSHAFQAPVYKIMPKPNEAATPPSIGASCTNESGLHHSSYVLAAFQTLHETLPYIKFAHLTANQAIIEAVQERNRIHIIDYDIMEGIQWPPLMQALANRQGGPPQQLHITALYRNTAHVVTSTTMTSSYSAACAVQEVGKRLADFAASLNLFFSFSQLKVEGEDHEIRASGLKTVKGEAVVINCMLHLPHMPHRTATSVSSFLKAMQRLCPLVLTLGEDELGPCSDTPSIPSFFLHALHHYSAIFDSLEASLSPNTEAAGRMLVERVFLAPRITSALAFCSTAQRSLSSSSTYEAEQTAARMPATSKWHTLVRAAGFVPSPLSFQNVSQARLLLGLFEDGFKVEEDYSRLVVEWRHQPVIAASAWRPD